MEPQGTSKKIKQVIVIGCGYAGLSAVQVLSRHKKELEIVVIDKGTAGNALPLLPDIIGRGIPSRYLGYPISLLGKEYGFTFINADVTAIDLQDKKVFTRSAEYPYDYALIASGSETNFYGNDAIKQQALPIDSPRDADAIRKRLLDESYEQIVIAGGGYTGIEVATNIRSFFTKRNKRQKIIIIERAADILGPLPAWMKEFVKTNLKRLSIEIITDCTIEEIQNKRIRLNNGTVFDKALLIWAAGVKTAEYLQKLHVPKNPQGRIHVDPYLRLRDYVYVIGDAAYIPYDGGALRMAVQFSIMQGRTAARNIAAAIEGKQLRPFKPLDLGFIIPMANDLSCGTILGKNMKGNIPTLLHYCMCVYRSAGWLNRWGIIQALIRDNPQRRITMVDIASLVLRLGLGIMFAAHGAQKALGMFGGPGVKGFSGMLQGLGFTPPDLWAYVGAYVELVGGLCLIIGLLTRVSATLLLVLISVAAYTVHLKKGFFLMNGGYEYTFVIASICLALMLLGGGKYSICNKF